MLTSVVWLVVTDVVFAPPDWVVVMNVVVIRLLVLDAIEVVI